VVAKAALGDCLQSLTREAGRAKNATRRDAVAHVRAGSRSR
jgi:hypothetical protein